MRNAVIACLALAALAACASDAGRDGAENTSYQAAFAPEEPDLVVAEVTDDEPVTAARLVMPDGTSFEAHSIDTDRRSGGASSGIYPSVGVGVSGGSSSNIATGIGIGFPIFGSSGPTPPPEYRSTARIRVTDMTAYRAQWQKSELRLTLGEGAAEHQVAIPAPEPPAP